MRIYDYYHANLIAAIKKDNQCGRFNDTSAELIASSYDRVVRECREELNELSMAEVLAGKRMRVSTEANVRVVGTHDGAQAIPLNDGDFRAFDRILNLSTEQRVEKVLDLIRQDESEYKQQLRDESEETIKKQMKDFGMPDSLSLYQLILQTKTNALAEINVNAWNIEAVKKIALLFQPSKNIPKEAIEEVREKIREVLVVFEVGDEACTERCVNAMMYNLFNIVS